MICSRREHSQDASSDHKAGLEMACKRNAWVHRTHVTLPLTAVVLASAASTAGGSSVAGSASFWGAGWGAAAAGGATGPGADLGAAEREPSLRRSA